MTSSQSLQPHNFKDLLDSVEAFLFDCDGNSIIIINISIFHSCIVCIYMFFLQNSIHVTFSGLGVIWKGDELIDGASQTLDMLRSKVTN